MLSTGDGARNKIVKNLCFPESYILGGETDNGKIKYGEVDGEKHCGEKLSRDRYSLYV